MSHKMKPGKQLEKLVSTLEKVLVGREDTTVISPYFTKDRITGDSREHDVVILIKRGHHETKIAIECRDRSRAVGVPELEGFYLKCQDTGMERGAIVSSKGFYKSTLKKAAHLGIDCLRVSHVEAFDWITKGGMNFYQSRILHAHYTAIPEEDIATRPTNFVIQAPDGTEFSRDLMLKNISTGVNQLMSNKVLTEGLHEVRFRIQSPGFTIEDRDAGKAIPMKHFNVKATVVIEHTKIPIKNVVYSREGLDDPLGRVSIASFDSMAIPGDLVFSRNPDESTTIFWVPKT